jgi:hypothetical protein
MEHPKPCPCENVVRQVAWTTKKLRSKEVGFGGEITCGTCLSIYRVALDGSVIEHTDSAGTVRRIETQPV